MKNGIRERNKIVLITTITLTQASKQASKQASNKFPLTHPGKHWQTLANASTICCLRAFPISLSRGKFNACANETRINNNPKQHRSKENSEKQKRNKK